MIKKKHHLAALIFILFWGTWGNSPELFLAAEGAGGSPAAYLPIVSNSFVPSSDTALFGVQMYGNTGVTSPYHPYLLGSNANWLRVNLSWELVERVESDPSGFDWSHVDRNLSAALPENGGLEIIATIENNPSWAASVKQGPIDPEDVDEFAEFMAALAERFDGDGVDDAPGSPQVLYWELYNEPDRVGDRWGDDGARYAQMLAAVYPEVKNANPYAKIVMGGIAYDWFEEDGGPFAQHFLDDVFSAGGGNYLDVMNFHVYPSFSVNWTGQTETTGVIAKTEAIRNVLSSYNLNMPIIVTESGHHDNNAIGASSTPELQSRYVVTILTEAMAADLDVMIWWMLYDLGNFYSFNTGLVTNSDNPVQTKQSYGVYQNVINELGTSEFVRTLSAAETGSGEAAVHQFANLLDESTIYVAWRSVVTSDDYVTIKIPGSSATVRDSVTYTATVVNDGDDGSNDNQITLQVNGRPRYIEVQP
ncbi:MAG: cellulase family glycosylhydrolase [Chloroflexota bacterium]